MTLPAFLDLIQKDRHILANSEAHNFMTESALTATGITMQLNQTNDPTELRRIFSQLIGKPVPDSFMLFPPFHTDFGKNITVGAGSFINSGCHFQDQGGITIGKDTLIGHNVVLATIDHDLHPARRKDMYLSPIVIGDNVWIGSNAPRCYHRRQRCDCRRCRSHHGCACQCSGGRCACKDSEIYRLIVFRQRFGRLSKSTPRFSGGFFINRTFSNHQISSL